MRLACCLVLFLPVLSMSQQPTVLDRVAVIVGRRAIKSSDVERDLRATAFLNRQPLDLSPDSRRKAADRLIDQELIRQEILIGGYARPSDQDSQAVLDQLRRDRFAGSAAQLRAALSRYGLSEQQLQEYMQWQLTVLRFIDQRFRPGIVVTDEELRAYLQKNRTATEDQARESLIAQRVDESFEEWLKESRRRTRIAFRDAAFERQ